MKLRAGVIRSSLGHTNASCSSNYFLGLLLSLSLYRCVVDREEPPAWQISVNLKASVKSHILFNNSSGAETSKHQICIMTSQVTVKVAISSQIAAYLFIPAWYLVWVLEVGVGVVTHLGHDNILRSNVLIRVVSATTHPAAATATTKRHSEDGVVRIGLLRRELLSFYSFIFHFKFILSSN